MPRVAPPAPGRAWMISWRGPHEAQGAHRYSHIGTLWNIKLTVPGSLQFDPRKLDHLGPFLSIRGYEFSELAGRHRHLYHSHVCKPRLCLCISSKRSIDLVVEFVDDLNRRVLWRTNAQPPA